MEIMSKEDTEKTYVTDPEIIKNLVNIFRVIYSSIDMATGKESIDLLDPVLDGLEKTAQMLGNETLSTIMFELGTWAELKKSMHKPTRRQLSTNTKVTQGVVADYARTVNELLVAAEAMYCEGHSHKKPTNCS